MHRVFIKSLPLSLFAAPLGLSFTPLRSGTTHLASLDSGGCWLLWAREREDKWGYSDGKRTKSRRTLERGVFRRKKFRDANCSETPRCGIRLRIKLKLEEGTRDFNCEASACRGFVGPNEEASQEDRPLTAKPVLKNPFFGGLRLATFNSEPVGPFAHKLVNELDKGELLLAGFEECLSGREVPLTQFKGSNL
jgi:hypothetical protein